MAYKELLRKRWGRMNLSPNVITEPRVHKRKKAIGAHERALCQLTVCFQFQSKKEKRKGHKICAL